MDKQLIPFINGNINGCDKEHFFSLTKNIDLSSKKINSELKFQNTKLDLIWPDIYLSKNGYVFITDRYVYIKGMYILHVFITGRSKVRQNSD